MRIAPKYGETVLISDLVDPALTMRVVEVVGYDPAHDAWQVGVDGQACRTCKMGYIPAAEAKLWSRRLGDVWVLYDVSSPLPG